MWNNRAMTSDDKLNDWLVNKADFSVNPKFCDIKSGAVFIPRDGNMGSVWMLIRYGIDMMLWLNLESGISYAFDDVDFDLNKTFPYHEVLQGP